MNKKTIVLAADERYSEKVLTTIKSICYYNQSIRFYLLNKNYSQEWFDNLNTFLPQLNSEIIDVKITSQEIEKYRTLNHISSETTYYRYFISDLLQEEVVLYLDCDLVVNGELDKLFNIELNKSFLAACTDDLALNFFNELNFNAGVLLINNLLWREENITQKLLLLSEKYISQVRDCDQSILNILFKGHWKEINQGFNYLVGGEYLYLKNNRADLIKRKPRDIPLIMHFNTEFKPWLPIYNLPFREYYWFYKHLTWQDIFKRHKIN